MPGQDPPVATLEVLPGAPLSAAEEDHAAGLASRRTFVRMLHGFATVASFTLAAKAVSFVKEAAVARQFGVSDDLDAFVLAFTLLTFLASMLGVGMPDAFLPVFTRIMHERGPAPAHRLGFQMTLCNFSTLCAASAALYFGSPLLISWMGRGFGPEKQAVSVSVMRGLLPFFVSFGMTYHFGIWLRAQKRFVMPALAPAFAPAFIIICLVASGKNASVSTLVLGTNLGVILHITFLFLATMRTVPHKWQVLRHVLSGWENGSREVIVNTVPFLLAGVVVGSAPVIDQIMASWLQPGSVTVLGYSEKITSIVLALSAAPASEALFPFFADAVTKRDWRGVRTQLLQVTGTILIVAVPVTLLMCWLAPLTVRTLFERGAFTAGDTARVAEVLRYSVFQVPFYIASILAARIAVSMQASRFMLGMAFASLSVNVIFNAWLMRTFGVAGIAISTVIVHLFSAVCFYTFAMHRIRRNISQEAGS